MDIMDVYYDADGNEYSVLEPKPYGEGGFGVVLKVEGPDGKLYAIKVVKKGKTKDIRMLENESTALNIEDDNVIRYVYYHDGDAYSDYPPYLIMEFADGGTLREVIKKKKESKTIFTNEELCDYYRQLSKGMKAVNARLVHRDIKPENILISDGLLKISDFGLVKIDGEVTRSPSKTFKGYRSEAYYAPEAWDNRKNTIQMDIYAMGIVFYELATLNYPYGDVSDIKMAHKVGNVQRVRSFNPNIAPALETLIMKMLEKRPSDRIKDWDDVLEVLDHISSESDDSEPETKKIANSLLRNENARQQAIKKATNKENEKKLKRGEHYQIIDYSFKQAILNPIDEICVAYNKSLPSGTRGFSFETTSSSGEYAHDASLQLPDGCQIEISMCVLFEEDFPLQRELSYSQKMNYANMGFGNVTSTQIPYPKFHGKKVLAYGLMAGVNSRKGYNILLLKESEDDEYGTWYKMRNEVTMGNDERGDWFVFEYEELPEKINNLNHTHLRFNSEVTKFETADIRGILNIIPMFEKNCGYSPLIIL